MYAYLDHNNWLLCYQVANDEIYDLISPFTVLITVLPCKPMANNNNLYLCILLIFPQLPFFSFFDMLLARV